MTDMPLPGADALVDAQRKLVGVTEQVEAMQVLLVRLLQDVVRAEGRLANARGGQPATDRRRNGSPG
jgi:hypothetical protein